MSDNMMYNTQFPRVGSAPELQMEAFHQAYARGQRNFARWSLVRADLHGMDLRDVIFFDADLTGANLAGSDLSRANLGRANLSSANLRGANLSDAFLYDARLAGADTTSVITDRPSEQPQQQAGTTQAPGPEPPATHRFCMYCGVAMSADGAFCPACGRAQPTVTVPLSGSARPYPASASSPMYPSPIYVQPPYVQPTVTAGSAHPKHGGIVTAAIANAVAVLAFFVMPFGAATNLAGPQLANATSQNASLICPYVSSDPQLSPVCSYFTIGAPVMWGIVIAAGLALLVAGAGALGGSSSHGAAVVVLLCDILGLLGFGYAWIGGESAVQALQQAGALYTVIGFGSGGVLMIVGLFVASGGAIAQLRSDH